MNRKTKIAQPNYKKLNQSELTNLAQQGDHKAFGVLIKPLSPKIYARALKALDHEADAHDILQDTLLKAYSKLYTFRQESRFSSWVYQICTHQILSRYRQRTQKKYYKRYHSNTSSIYDWSQRDLPQLRSQPLASKDQYMVNKDQYMVNDHDLNRNHPELNYLNQEYIQHIKDAIEHLDHKYGSVLQLWIQGLDLSQIQVRTDLSRSAVKSRIARARQSLKISLQRLGFEQ